MRELALQPDRDDRPHEDHFVVLHGVSWSDYQRVLEVRGEHSSPRIAYLEGRLEIMRPSESHERIKSLIGCLVEVWCLERGIEFTTLGSWTLEDKATDRGIEPNASAQAQNHSGAVVVDVRGGIGCRLCR